VSTLKNHLFTLLFSAVFLLFAACQPVTGPQPGPVETQAQGLSGAQTPGVVKAPGATQPSGESQPPSQTQAPGGANPLAGTKWTLISFGQPGAETSVIQGTTVTLEFDSQGQAGGSGGCNTYGVPYEVQGNSLSFGQISSTLIACVGEGIGEQEQRYFQALETASRFELDEEILLIWYRNEAEVLSYIRTDSFAVETLVPVTPQAGEELCPSRQLLSGSDWNICHSQEYGFEVQYPPTAELVDQTATYARIDLPFVPGTNLNEKYLEIEVRENVQPCSSPHAEGYGPGAIPSEIVVSNGLRFIKESGQDAGAGNIYNWVAYSISRDNLCYSLSFVLHSHQPELDPTPPPTFDMEAESEIFAEIVGTFRWLDSAASPTHTPTAAPTPSPVRINFQPGATSATVKAELPASGSDLYVLRALEGQTMTVELSFTEGKAILAIWGKDGEVLISDHAEATRFQGVLPSTQDYFILLKGRPDGSSEYSLKVTIPPLEEDQPTPVRINFEPGASSAIVTGKLEASGSDLYVLRALKGQTMEVDVSFDDGQAILAIWGADGTVLVSDHAEASSFSGVLPSSQDYYILLKGSPDGETEYRMEVAIPPN
jgi:heat shock protein HslJ